MNDQNLITPQDTQKRADLKSELLLTWKQIGHSASWHFSEAWMELNLTIAQLKCLFFLDLEGPSNQKTIAAILGVTPPNVTGIIDRLVEQHLVTRHANESNRRMQVIALTSQSKTLLSELKTRKDNHLAALLDQIQADDLEALLRGLKALHLAEEKADQKAEATVLRHQFHKTEKE
jgi:MarR family transcriptional regulator, organic hydroperoxide resistance regulator